MLLKVLIRRKVLPTAVAGVHRIVIGVSEAADPEVLLAGEALEIRDEVPVLVVQQQVDVVLHQPRILRLPHNIREILRQ